MCYKCAANALSALHYALAASAFQMFANTLQMHCKCAAHVLQVCHKCAVSSPHVHITFPHFSSTQARNWRRGFRV